ncbi:hypothetical protein OQA88_7642 [Cercophora sp. LCS_1]
MASHYNNIPGVQTGSAPEGTYGPHATRLANADRQNGPSTHRTTAASGTTTANENTGERVARNIKGTVAQGHGLTESLRGNINSAIDSLVGDTEKAPRDEAIARAGDREFMNKEFEKKGTMHKNF